MAKYGKILTLFEVAKCEFKNSICSLCAPKQSRVAATQRFRANSLQTGRLHTWEQSYLSSRAMTNLFLELPYTLLERILLRSKPHEFIISILATTHTLPNGGTKDTFSFVLTCFQHALCSEGIKKISTEATSLTNHYESASTYCSNDDAFGTRFQKRQRNFPIDDTAQEHQLGTDTSRVRQEIVEFTIIALEKQHMQIHSRCTCTAVLN